MRCATMGLPGFGVRATDPPPRENVYVVPQGFLRHMAQAELAGRDARHSGLTPADNPYHVPMRLAAREAWQRGYEQG